VPVDARFASRHSGIGLAMHRSMNLQAIHNNSRAAQHADRFN
jgi:hypothetical protein